MRLTGLPALGTCAVPFACAAPILRSRSPAENSSSPGFGAPYWRQCSIWESLGIERARLAGVARVEKGMWQVGRGGQDSGPSPFY